MTEKEAYAVLGLPPGTEMKKIQKRYRHLMMQVHPDAQPFDRSRAEENPGEHNEAAGNTCTSQKPEVCPYSALEINIAYEVLKKRACPDNGSEHRQGAGKAEKKRPAWNAPVNEHAYADREILHCAEDSDGTVLGHFTIARGKYLWNTEEDFSLFLMSLYRCSRQLLEEQESRLRQKAEAEIRLRFQAELAYLLAQQFIDGSALLAELAREEPSAPKDARIFFLSCALELAQAGTDRLSLQPGELLYPAAVRRHRLYLKNQAGQELGYLSFADDRLYYIVIPLLEQKRVQIRIRAEHPRPSMNSDKQPASLRLHVWLRLPHTADSAFPDHISLRIEQLLEQYRQHLLCVNHME